MAGIWRDIEIQFKGETYTVRPTMAFVNYLERKEGCSLSKLLIRMHQQDLPSGIACEVIASTLTFAGCKTTAEEVYEETGGIGADLVLLTSTIVTSCLPQSKSAQASTGAKKKAVTKK